MRISDWSSDVCSSDLLLPGLLVDQPDQGKLRPPQVASLGCQTFHIACSAYADQRVRCAEVTRAPHTCRVNDRSAIIGTTSRYESPATPGLPTPARASSAQTTVSSTLRSKERRVGKVSVGQCRSRWT